MTQRMKDAWIAALRGGVYKQGRFTLHLTKKGNDPGDGHFCAIGVFCHLKDPYGWHAVCDALYDENGSYVGREEYRSRYEWKSPFFDLENEHEFLPCESMMKIAIMNDRGKMSFAEIADWIEANVEASDADKSISMIATLETEEVMA